MAPVASKLDSLPFNCYELGHTWSPYCTKAAAEVGFYCFRESFKIYGTLQVLSVVLSRRFPRNKEEVLRILKDVTRSASFLSMNGFGFVTFFCLFRKIFGSFNFFTIGFLPALFACYIAILVEKPSRRPLLALYVTNVASETVFRMLKSRGYVGNIKNFDMFLFVLSSVTILYQMKKGNRRGDIIDKAFTKILGKDEFLSRDRPGEVEEEIQVEPEEDPSNRPIAMNAGGLVIGDDDQNMAENQRRRRLKDQSYTARFIRFVLWFHKCVEDIAVQLERMVCAVNEGRIHERCVHKEPCLDYWLKGFATRFLAGFGIRSGIQVLLVLKQLLTSAAKSKGNPKPLFTFSVLKQMLIDCIRSGAGLSAMCLAFRLLNCSFRWLSGSDDARGSIASAVMSMSLGFILLRPPSYLGLYLFFKAAETVIQASHRENDWKVINWLDSIYGGGYCLLYAVSTAILFHAGMLEPQNLKPSYYVFLLKVTGRKLQDINRHLFTVYGTNSNILMHDFWPKLNPRFLSQHMKSFLKLKNAQGLDNQFVKDLAMQFVSK